MELNDDHIEIMMEVREILQARLTESDIQKNDAGGFICVQILRILGRREGLEYPASSSLLSPEGRVTFGDLTNAIAYAIRVQTQFETFKLTSSVGIYLNNLDLNIGLSRLFDEVAHLARLAWLDKMIETRVLA